MSPIVIYLLKVSLGIALVSIPYYLLLRNDSLLVVKRIYLFTGIALAWIFPFLVLSKPGIAPVFEPTFFIDPEISAINSGEISLPHTTSTPINWTSIIVFVYLLGMFLIFLKNITAYIKTRSNHSKENSGQKDVILTNNDQVFTIFSKIFLPKKYQNESELYSILIHERAHIHQLHFIDVLLSELTLLLTWFNPFSWLISMMIKENHEHLADRSVLRQGVNPAHYKALLLNHAMGGEVFRLGHQLNHSLTKKRFKMMKKMKAPKTGFLKYIFIVPVILGFTLIATAASAQKAKTIHGKVYLEKIGEPAIGASVVISESTIGTVVDLDGTFSLEVEGNPIISISFVGYGTVHKTAKEISAKPVILQQSTFKIDVPGRPSMAGATVKAKSGKELKEEPVYVVDGEKRESINYLDHEEIESVSVYKDPDNAIVKKYNAKSGVVMIKTKSAAFEEKAKLAESQEEEEVFFVVEDIPSFPGGRKALSGYIYDNMVYPEEAIEHTVIGSVTVQFNVEHDGSLKNIQVVENHQNKNHPEISDNIFDEAALKLINDMPNWKPGKQRGKPVRTTVQIPVRFMNTKYHDVEE
ncbi:MAG: TonB family protein [Bacteroidales bacterium]|jgi:TonB family protein|nr:TonB family protein [Bacteroidales bacterium]